MHALTVVDMLRATSRRTPHAPVLTMATTGETVTYAQLEDRAARLAAGLRALGLSRGDTLAVWLSNSIEWVALEFAAAQLGVLLVGLNPRYKAGEVAHLLGVSEARVLVFAPMANSIDYAGMVAEALETAGDSARVTQLVVVDAGTGYELTGARHITVTRFEELLDNEVAGEAQGRPEDLINVFGTSGTTSFPKLATHDQKSACRHAAEVAAALDYTADESVLCFLPFCGAYGFITLTSTIAAGARGVIMPVFKPEDAIEVIATEGITSVLALEATIRALFAVPGLSAEKVRSWQKGGIAGLSAGPLVQRADEDFGVRLTNLYGSSELFAMMSCWPLDATVEQRSLAGGRLLGTDMHARAVDPQTRAVLDDGRSGELEFFGYNVTPGYLANPGADEKAFTSDGWYRSGDQGATLENRRAVRYEGRLADTLRLRGYLVSPTEIEELLTTHDAVSDVQVVGAPNPATGEDRAVAFVLSSDPPEGLEAELRRYCREKVASWKVPDAVLFVSRFPTTPSPNGEKVQRTRLREMATTYFAELEAANAPAG